MIVCALSSCMYDLYVSVMQFVPDMPEMGKKT